MLYALRAELAYSRPWLFGGLGIAAGVVVIISVVFWFVGDEGPPPFVADGLRGFFPIIAGMVVGFIAQGLRSDERRARLLMAGPLTPLQLGGVMVLLPAILFGAGVLGSAVVICVGFLLTGHLELEGLRMAGGFAGVFFTSGQMGPLVQESSAARRQRRPRAAFAGWAVFVMAILFLTAFQWIQHTIYGQVGPLLAGMAIMVVSVVLFTGRTDFTR